MVERAVGKRERLGGCLDQLYAPVEAPVCDGQHLDALIHARDLEAALQELGRDESRARGDVEDVPLRRQAGDEEAAPERVLAEGEHCAHSVVGRAERREEAPRVESPV